MVCVSVPAVAGADALAAGATDAAATGAAGAIGSGALDAGMSALPAVLPDLGAGVADAGVADAGMSALPAALPDLGATGATGLGGLLSSIGSGISDGLNSIGSGISSAFGSSGADAAAGANGVAPGVAQGFDAAGDSVAMNSPDAVGFGTSASGVMPSAQSAGSAASKGLLGLNTSNPLNDALAATTGLSAIQALLPKKPVNIGQNAANVMATNPSFSNPNLPQYTMQNTATPYSGNWYTYGETPQAVQYNAQPTLVPNQAAYAKTGGLVDGYAKGGPVHSYAMGGPLRAPMPPAHQPYIRPMTPQTQPRQYAMGGSVAPMMPPQGAPMGGPAAPMPMQGMPPQRPAMPPQQPQGAVNPLMLKAVHNIGVAIGKHIKSHMPMAGAVHGAGGGHDDLVPAKLSDGEYVHSADVVAALGDGSSKEGGKKLKVMDAAIRAHKTKNGSKFPPKAKNPLKYLPKGSI